MRGLWPHRVFGGDPLPPVQVGLEECASRERDGGYAQAGQASSFSALSELAVHGVTSQYLHSTNLGARR